MQKKILRVSSQSIVNMLLSLIFLIAAIKTITNYHTLTSKSYKINVEQVVLIDTFFQKGKADYISSSKSSTRGYILNSINGYSFRIRNSAFEGINDRNEFENHLKYHGLQFIAYSDQATLDKYLSSKIPFGLDLFQIKIGNKNFIDIEKGNSGFRLRLQYFAFIHLLLVIGLLIYLFIKIRYKRNS